MRPLFRTKTNWWVLIGLIGVGLWWWSQQTALTLAEPAANPTVTVFSPSGAAADTIGEGDDYFTQVLHEPRDMNQHTDLMWQEFGIDNIAFSNGLWNGTVTNSSGYAEIFALYPGFSHLPSSVGVAEVGKTGWNYPVQASKYKQLSFRLKAPAGASSSWWHAAYMNVSFTLDSGHFVGNYTAPSDNWQVYVNTLPWSSPIYGLAFRFGLVTGNYQFDWIRLTDPNTSPAYTINFYVEGTQSGDVVDLLCYTSAQLTNANYCGSIATNIPVNTAATYQYVWRTAYLPPGAYYVQAVVRRASYSASDVSDGPLTIKPAPMLDFTAPSMTSGPDYATEVLGNPWDMNDDSDIFTATDLYRKPHDFVAPCPCFGSGELYGTVQRLDPIIPAGFSDPYVYLRVSRNNPVDTSKYKYLTYRLKVDRSPWWPSSNDRLAWDSARNVYPAAWLARLIAFGTFPPDLAVSDSTKAIIEFDDWNTYQMDLSQGIARGYWDPTTPLTGGYWTGLKYALRFDFLEGVDPWMVHLADVKLTGDDVANASFTVRWSYPGAGTPASIDFYASQNRNTCLASGSLILHWQASGTGTQLPPAGPYRAYLPLIFGPTFSSGPDNFVWNTTAVAAAKYYICARASDGYNTFSTVSDTPVVISH